MSFNFLGKLNILKERETYANVKSSIDKSASAEGTNLWILFFAILIASLGLNTNSTAVVIGAMLISPLIGPIIALGFGVATNDFPLIKKAIISYLFSTVVGIGASALYFWASPIADAHSELLARISPTIYDVLIALLGGFAGVIAISSKQKGNVIPGVAIATAIMPPLCTAGYGLATGQFQFFFGAFYLYIINSVFIFAATIITTRYMNFRKKKYDNPDIEKREAYIIWSLIILTLIPSLFLGYTFVQKNNFVQSAEKFIAEEAFFHNNFLLKKEIDPDTKTIQLTYGGRIITEDEKVKLVEKLKYFDLKETKLVIQNGFTIEEFDKNAYQEKDAINRAMSDMALEKQFLQAKLDSVESQNRRSDAILKEIKILYPDIQDGLITVQKLEVDSTQLAPFKFVVLLKCPNKIVSTKRSTIEKWLKTRLESEDVELVLNTP
jgi:uncharacterized hydrophobic protein (TIGR00271 family)